MEAPDSTVHHSKKSLVLAGGGVRLAYHAGVLMALEEEGLIFDHIDGTSGGIFGAAMRASGLTPIECAKRWRDVRLKGFISMLPLGNYKNRRSLKAMGGTSGIREKIFPALGIHIEKINTNRAFDTTFNVCNFSTKTIEAIPHTHVTEDHLIAGMSLPIFMPAIRINNQWYTDGVWIKDANITEAVSRGAEEIWLVWCIGNTSTYFNGFFNQYVHMIEMSANGGLFVEIDWLKGINKERESKGLKPIVLHVIKPAYPLPLDPDFFLNRINADTLINWGYADAKQYLNKKVPFDLSQKSTQATSMKNPEATLHFRQQFKGEILFKGQVNHIYIYLSIFIQQMDSHFLLLQFSSISIDDKDCRSGYNNVLIKKGKGRLLSKFDFTLDGAIFNAQLELDFKSPLHLLLGLNFKTARVCLSYNNKQQPEVVFFQPIINRLKNAFYLHMKAETGYFKKQQLKHRMLNTLLE